MNLTDSSLNKKIYMYEKNDQQEHFHQVTVDSHDIRTC